jgi:hypothetical protein
MAISTVNITNKQNAGEPNTQGAFSIVRTGDLTQPLTISLVTPTDTSSSSYATPGEDYQVLPTTVTFAAGQSSLDLPVIPIDDTIPENTQTVKVSIVADAAYTLGTSQTATVTIADNDLVATIPATTINKTAAEAGYTITKLSSNTIAGGYSKISGNLVVWQEGTGATATLRLFDGTTTKTLSTGTSSVYKPAFLPTSTRIDNGKVVWGQFVDELLGGYQVPIYHTFLYDGTTTTDIGKTTGADFAGDRIAWATADGINIYRISDKSNTLVPGAKDVTNLVIDSDKSIVWNENKLASSFSGVSAQTLRFYDGTKIVDLVTLPAGQDAYTQPAIVTASVSGSKVVYVSKGDLYLYNNGQSIKIAESVQNSSFGINGDRVFYQAKELNSSLTTERWYGISSGKTENPIENNFGAGVSIGGLNTDGKNNTWFTTQPTLITGSDAGTKANLYIDDGTTRVNLATSGPSVIENLVYTAVSGSNVIYDTFTPATVNDPSSSKIALYLASKDSLPNIPVNNAPIVANPISAQSIVSGSPLKFSLAANTFTDPDAGDVLSYSAKLNNNSNLPAWLTFDAVTRTFAGTPAAADVGNFGIVVTATDKAGLTVTNSFGLTVTAAIVIPVNNAPVVANPISTQSIVSGSALKFIFAANTFTDPDSGDVLSYSAKLANGSNLPTWLTFDAATRTFAGTPAAGDAGNLSIAVTATDKGGLTVASNFGLNVTAAVVPPISSPAPANFTSPTRFAVGLYPNSVTSGDFNGDGIVDLVTANGSNTVSVLLGNGKGSFGTATNFAAGNAPNTITARDLNGDGILDLVTANLLSNNVSVLLGDGKGSFGTPTSFDVGYFPSSVTVGDFNGDRILDLVTADPYNNNLSVLLGNGKGSFGTPTKFAVSNNPNFVVVSDFNSDGISDLATTNYIQGNSSVSVLLGNGKGSFGAPSSFSVGVHPDVDGNPILATVGDFNGDGIVDLVTANYGSIDVSVLLGNGKGGFGTATNFAVGGSPTSVTVGDFNNDGVSDLATTNSAYSISVLLGDGKGSFGTATNYPGYRTPTASTVGDFNGDGLADLAIAEYDGNVSILLNQKIAAPVNNAPVVANPIATQSIISGSLLKFVFAANTFTDPDAGDVLTYSAKLANGNNLPTWLTFDAVTRTFAGTPAAGDVGNLSIAVTATDKAGLTVASNFGLNITGVVPPSSGGPIAGLTILNNLFSTDAFLKGFGITAISQKPTTKANEIGFFAVDDLSGKVNGIAFSSVGYTKAVLDAAKPIFSTLGGNFFSSNKQEFAIDPNKIYEFFEIQDGSILDLRQQIAGGKTPTNIRYSFPDASGNSLFKLTTNSKFDGYQISVNTDELVLDLVNLAGSSVNLPIGTKSQAKPEGRTIDFTDYVGKTLKVDITTISDAAYDNNIGFYTVEDSIGSIKLANGNIITTDNANYAVEAIKNALTNSQLQAGKNDSKLDRTIVGGKTYAPVMVAQGTLNDFVTKNSTNSGDGSAIHAYFNYLGANPDKLDHFRLIGNNTFGLEDMYGGGDRDFNDLVVNFNVKSVV